jgi:hypothetical protein
MKTLSEYFNLPPNSFATFLNAQDIVEQEEQRQLENNIVEYFQKKKEECK